MEHALLVQLPNILPGMPCSCVRVPLSGKLAKAVKDFKVNTWIMFMQFILYCGTCTLSINRAAMTPCLLLCQSTLRSETSC